MSKDEVGKLLRVSFDPEPPVHTRIIASSFTGIYDQYLVEEIDGPHIGTIARIPDDILSSYLNPGFVYEGFPFYLTFCFGKVGMNGTRDELIKSLWSDPLVV